MSSLSVLEGGLYSTLAALPGPARLVLSTQHSAALITTKHFRQRNAIFFILIDY